MEGRENFELLGEITEEFLSEVKAGIRAVESAFSLDEKEVKFRVKDGGRDRSSSKREKAGKALEVLGGLLQYKEDIKEILGTVHHLLELNNRAKELSGALEVEIMKLENYRGSIKEKSETIRELLQVYREQVEKVMKIVEYLPADTEEEFLRKLNLIDRSNELLRDINQLVVRYLST